MSLEISIITRVLLKGLFGQTVNAIPDPQLKYHTKLRRKQKTIIALSYCIFKFTISFSNGTEEGLEW